MKALERYRLTCKILASCGIISEGIYYSIVQPGIADLVAGGVCGLVLYCLWFNSDRKV